MATTITAGATTITPILIDGFEASRSGGSIVHPILGRTNPDITLRPAGMKTGTLSLLFAVEADANMAWNALSDPAVFVLSSDERTVSMSFVVPESQALSLKLDPETRDHWTLSVPFQEVTP
ncbi:hypothetical protein LXM50_01605 [Microbacterium sp. Au-Mic1]|uniref:hypothetical protein n=1 Tax=Microbacterium sp. Au-Mic1 TaxID=2906457 RepID=UPI001E5C07A1|nr:hypothetical protein [Microbacterium sp. Au-Mic1]MCE4024662.1 hypothetical protein [Microbacterium sp. Au-Mic1]